LNGPRFCASLLALLAAVGGALVVAGPLLAESGHPEGAALVRFFFAPVCHQIPERSFHLLGTPLPVCARCAGVCAGVLLAFLCAALGVRSRVAMRRTGAVLLAGVLPSLAGWILAGAGVIPDAAILRGIAGAILGAAGGACLLPAVEALCAELTLRRSGAWHLLKDPAGPSPSLPTEG
jgi:uncharacterized membrane protein